MISEIEDNNFEDRDSLVEDLLIGCWREVVPMSSYDVKIKLSDREITANKDIVMTRTKYFSLTLPRKASGTGAVDISHCSKAIMDKIIRILFSGFLQFGDLSLDQILNLHHMSTINKSGDQLMRETCQRKGLLKLKFKESAISPPRTIFSRRRTSKMKAQEENRG